MDANASSSSIVEDDDTITLGEFIDSKNHIESEAEALLGGADDKSCTYSSGYAQRQPLYACLTCIPKTDENPKYAGICLACSYSCHGNHELVELYTRRFFRCDCGNGLFNGIKCNLEPNKDQLNEKNTYNKNFHGLYCTCLKPYPDEENTEDMEQCFVCEDWFHTSHLNIPSGVSPDVDYGEMTCEACMAKLPFLKHYVGLSVKSVEKDKEAEKANVDVEGQVSMDIPADGAAVENKCLIEGKENDLWKSGAVFWPLNLRSCFCKCSSCLEMYERLNVPWIIDEQDTWKAYKSRNNIDTSKDLTQRQQEEEIAALNKLDRVQQIEVLHQMNDFKNDLKEYLGKFAETNTVVKKEDIVQFFSLMNDRKRQKIYAPPNTCK